jgi:hypothetical protein
MIGKHLRGLHGLSLGATEDSGAHCRPKAD